MTREKPVARVEPVVPQWGTKASSWCPSGAPKPALGAPVGHHRGVVSPWDTTGSQWPAQKKAFVKKSRAENRCKKPVAMANPNFQVSETFQDIRDT